MNEIVVVAITCFLMTLFGLSLGFGLLKIQGDSSKLKKRKYDIDKYIKHNSNCINFFKII